MSPPSRPIFLERQGYRQRRLIDAARLLPVLGVILLAVPLLWPEADSSTTGLGEGSPGEGLPTSRAIIYIFATWAGLALVSGILVRALSAEAVERLDGGLLRQGHAAEVPPLPPLRADAESDAIPDEGPDAAPGAGGETGGEAR
ncbi:hypothetical protein SAMN06297129_3509 [Pseudooceanicola antarcticus]|uniref:Uncharacterized protein n=1 Tax=Pseudooceanicola antarcticus TaxID=1247613 RepID=A0A285JCT0_9RHOB|nr:hypothetical protein SAMN06297129_3509 [Pseudooceanicola antarcticus]